MQIHWILPSFMGPPRRMKPIHGPGTQVKKPASRIPQFDIIFLSAPEGNPHKNFLLNLRFSMKICVSLRYGYNFVSLTTLFSPWLNLHLINHNGPVCFCLLLLVLISYVNLYFLWS